MLLYTLITPQVVSRVSILPGTTAIRLKIFRNLFSKERTQQLLATPTRMDQWELSQFGL